MMNERRDFEMVAKTLFGMEEVLAEELRSIGAKKVQILNRAVSFRGDKKLLYKVNYNLRLALKILVPLVIDEVRDEKGLYDFIRSIDWQQYLTLKDTFAIETVLKTELFKHSQYVSQKIKDAIVDQFREKFGERPSVDLDKPSLQIHAFISNNKINLSLNSSGDPLNRRGYRQSQGLAPLNEVLAAGLIKLTGWDGTTPFVDPMCGSGTILLEAAFIANNIPPGALGREYGFQKWADYEPSLFSEMIKESTRTRTSHVPIIGSDISPSAFRISVKHAQNAGLSERIKFYNCDFEDMKAPDEPGILITNPPYGERIKQNDLNNFYKRLGDKLKKSFAGYQAWIFSGNMDALKNMGLHPGRKVSLYNGQLPCKFLQYKLYEGSMKVKNQ